MTVIRTISDLPDVVSLHAGPLDPAEVGSKAANLARARAARLPVLDGFVIPPGLVARIVAAPRAAPTDDIEPVRAAWSTLSQGGGVPVVVRSSSLAEDTERSSQAGVFESVVDVRGWDGFLDAVHVVAASGSRAGPGADRSMAVLVQRHLDPARSGVLFTVDPVSGRTDHLVVAVVAGGPQGLVGGAEAGTRIVLDRRARVVDGRRRSPLTRREHFGLARLARRAEALFDRPQDIEWAIGGDGRLHLLQSRPITAVTAPVAGPVFGTGPVAETFPDPLQPLEEDLWLDPLREALRVVLGLTGGASRRSIDRSPVVITIGGRPAIDLGLLDGGQRRRGLALLDPRSPLRRLRVAWQVGRLRLGLPTLIDDLLARLDTDLGRIPALDSLSDTVLLGLLDRGRASLRAAHGYELLAGTLTTDGSASGAGLALNALRLGRRHGMSDAEIVAAHPAVLSLTPPAIGGTAMLPPDAPDAGLPDRDADPVAVLEPREALRLRIRWLHELTARAAWTLGERLTASGQLAQPAAVAGLDLPTLAQALHGGAVVDPSPPRRSGPHLPVRFRVAADGTPVAVHDGPADGTPAGGGRAIGVVDQSGHPAPGSVLVVETLDPRLAAALPALAGLVSATGSPLSHLAILAREHGVATVVGVADAIHRFPSGTELLVDGTSGEVSVLHPARAGEAAP